MAFLKRKFELGVVYNTELPSSVGMLPEINQLKLNKNNPTTLFYETFQIKNKNPKSSIDKLREKFPKNSPEELLIKTKASEKLKGYRNYAKENWGRLFTGSAVEFIKNTFNIENTKDRLNNLKENVGNRARKAIEYHQATKKANEHSINNDIANVKAYNEAKMKLELQFPGYIEHIKNLRKQRSSLNEDLFKTTSNKRFFIEWNQERRQVNRKIKLNEQSLKKIMKNPKFKKLFDQFEESGIKIRQSITSRWPDAVSFAQAESDPIKFEKTLLGRFYKMTNRPYPNQQSTQRQQGNTVPRQQTQTQDSLNLRSSFKVPNSEEKNSSIPDFSNSAVGDKFKLEYLDTNQPNMRVQNCEAEIEEQMGIKFVRITAGRSSKLYSIDEFKNNPQKFNNFTKWEQIENSQN